METYELHPPQRKHPNGFCKACHDRIARMNAGEEVPAAAAAAAKKPHAQLLPHAAARAST